MIRFRSGVMILETRDGDAALCDVREFALAARRGETCQPMAGTCGDSIESSFAAPGSMEITYAGGKEILSGDVVELLLVIGDAILHPRSAG